MTRNEWIAETAREYRVHGRWGYSTACLETFPTMADAIDAATVDAVVFDERGVAPWQTPAPALTDTAAKVVEAAEDWLVEYDSNCVNEVKYADQRMILAHAVRAHRAHLAAKQGGAS